MRTIPKPIFEESLDLIVEKALAPEFGGMTSRKAVSADPGHVPAWKIRLAIRNFLTKQIDIKKRLKEKTQRRQRDVEQEKYRRIVDGRACRA